MTPRAPRQRFAETLFITREWAHALTERGGKEEADVLVQVHVENDGKPIRVDVLEDPGAGSITKVNLRRWV